MSEIRELFDLDESCLSAYKEGYEQGYKDGQRDSVGTSEWITSGKYGTIDPLVQTECANCGCGEPTYVLGGKLVFCPNCGKRMVKQKGAGHD